MSDIKYLNEELHDCQICNNSIGVLFKINDLFVCKDCKLDLKPIKQNRERKFKEKYERDK